MTAALAVAALALVAAAFVLAPLFRPDAVETERAARTLSEEEDLHARYAMAVAALRDLEEDRATGKIGDADFEAEQSELQSKALDLMKRIDERAAGRP